MLYLIHRVISTSCPKVAATYLLRFWALILFKLKVVGLGIDESTFYFQRLGLS